MDDYYSRLLQHAARRPDEQATTSADGNLSFQQLAERVEDAAAGLHRAGLGGASIVGLTIEDEIEHLIATLALLRTGAWQVTLASHDPRAVRVDLAARVHTTHVLTDNPTAALDGLPTVVWPCPQSGSAPSIENGGLYLRTSGTTGVSNIVPFSARDIALQGERNPEYAVGRHLRLASIEHNNSKRHRLYCLYMGATSVFRPKSSTYDLSRYAAEQGVTCIDMSLMHAAELGASGLKGLSELAIRVGGSPVPYTLRRRIVENVGQRLYVRYGATECGTIAICPPGEHDEDETVGHPAEGLKLEIVDDQGAPVPRGVIGNIRIRGDGIATGYLDNPDQTARRFRDGWFWPGDVGMLRADGSLVVKGRSDEMLNLNGINIFPVEIERVLEEHASVRAAAVSALRSSVHGDIPIAAVELVPGEDITVEELMTYARKRLALRAPRQIVFLEQLPRNSQGKIVRQDVGRLVDTLRRGR